MALLVGLVLASVFAGPARAAPSKNVTPAATTATTALAAPGPESLKFNYHDFFNVPYGEWWDYRTGQYGDLPIDAECFNATSIANGICKATNAAVADSETYPYTDWFPNPYGSASVIPGAQSNNPVVYAPYRFDANGAYVPGYDLSQPVFLPVMNYAQAPGNSLSFNWNLHYLDTAEVNGLSGQGCPVSQGSMDGFIIRSQVSLTMDAQESRRLFNVPSSAVSQTDLQTWWNSNTQAPCYLAGPAELALQNWFVAMGGSSSTVGKYDIMNGYQYFYSPFYTNMVATVDADGTTHVTIDHVAWGTETLLARMFYWGNTSYALNSIDSTKAAGWWGMELSWMDGASFAGSLAPSWFNFTLSTAMEYHFQQTALPGPNGLYDHVDDVPIWSWGPILNDYVNDYSPKHLISELDRYPNPPYKYIHSTPGAPSSAYGANLTYDYVPDTWNLIAGESLHFQFPTGNVVFYDPNLTPAGANPTAGQYVQVFKPLGFLSTLPGNYGTFNQAAMTWDIVGPTTTGGPLGSPGPDGIPGTADDQYPLVPYGSITFVAYTPPTTVMNADLTGRSAWASHHHWVISKFGTNVTLNAKVVNLGNTAVLFGVQFKVYDANGNLLATISTAPQSLAVGGIVVVQGTFAGATAQGYRATAQVMFDSNGDGTLDATGASMKSFSFTVLP